MVILLLSGAVEKKGNDAAGESWVEGACLVEEVAAGAMADGAEKSMGKVFRVVRTIDLTFALALLKYSGHEVKDAPTTK